MKCAESEATVDDDDGGGDQEDTRSVDGVVVALPSNVLILLLSYNTPPELNTNTLLCPFECEIVVCRGQERAVQ